MIKSSIYKMKISLFMSFLVLFDQVCKFFAITYLKGQNDFVIIKDILCLHYLDGGNTGAAWGILSGQRVLFILFTFIAVFFISRFIKNVTNLYISTNMTVYRVFNIFLALLMAGAGGNLIDRVIRGYVVDFIYFELINFPIFNIADCYVSISCVGIIFICLFKIKEEDLNKIISLTIKKKKHKDTNNNEK